MTMNKPFLKWAGGKYRLLPQLLPLIPKGECLIEPFVGAGSIFINTDFNRYVLNDINYDLFDTLLTIKNMPNSVIDTCKRKYFIQENNNSVFYYSVRNKFNLDLSNPVERAAQFIYLNRHCFNGLCRYNKAAAFNVPFGKNKNVYFPEDEIRSFANKLLLKARLKNNDFETVIDSATQNQTIYCDPPYLNTFSNYSNQGFTIDDHKRLVSACLRAVSHGASVVISNSTDAKPLYEGFTVHEITAPRTIAANGNRQPVKEIVAILKP